MSVPAAVYPKASEDETGHGDSEYDNFDVSEESSVDGDIIPYDNTLFVRDHALLAGAPVEQVQTVVNEVSLPVFPGKLRRRTQRAAGSRKKKTVDHDFSSSSAPSDSQSKPNRSKIFTPEMDDALQQAVAKIGSRWEEVAAHLNFPGIKKEQYQKRYTGYLRPEVENRDRTPWTPELEKALIELVPQRTEMGLKGKETINWTKISKQLNRNYYDCQNKWNTIRKSSLSVGRFTAEEDDKIVKFVREWTGGGKGLWSSLEKQLNRRNDVIRKRWNLLQKKRKLADPVES